MLVEVIEHDIGSGRAVARLRHTPWVRPAIAMAAIGWGANQFAPLIVLYRQNGVSAAATEVMFGLYAVGLMPALLLGGRWSDRNGRKVVVVTALVLSLLASIVLMAGAPWHGLLFAGRCIAGISSGLAFGTGAAWIRELSAGHVHPHAGASRATLAMTIGFGCGPLAAGLVAQWARGPQIWAYAPHLALCVAALILLRRLDDSMAERPISIAGPHRLARPDKPITHLFVVIAPFAPWVFGAAAIALAYLPAVVVDQVGSKRLVFAAVATAIPALAGVLVQPVATKATTLVGGPLASAMFLTVAALMVGVWATAALSVCAVLVAALVLGAAYGITQFAGLAHVQQVARSTQLGAATSSYQALSYLGFAFPYLLALSQNHLGWSAAQGLSVVVVLAAATTIWLALVDRSGQQVRR